MRVRHSARLSENRLKPHIAAGIHAGFRNLKLSKHKWNWGSYRLLGSVTLSHQQSLDCWVSLYLFSRRVIENRYSSYTLKDFGLLPLYPTYIYPSQDLRNCGFRSPSCEMDTLGKIHTFFWHKLDSQMLKWADCVSPTSIFIQEVETTEMPSSQSTPSPFGAMSAVPIRNLGAARV